MSVAVGNTEKVSGCISGFLTCRFLTLSISAAGLKGKFLHSGFAVLKFVFNECFSFFLLKKKGKKKLFVLTSYTCHFNLLFRFCAHCAAHESCFPFAF